MSGPSVFNSPRHQALSKKSRSSSGEVGGCISCDQQSTILSIGSLSLQMGSIAPPLGTPARSRTRKAGAEPALSGCRPYPRRLSLSPGAKCDNCCFSLLALLAQIFCPRLHQPAPLVERVAAPTGGLDFAADCVCQRHLGNFGRKREFSRLAETRLLRVPDLRINLLVSLLASPVLTF